MNEIAILTDRRGQTIRPSRQKQEKLTRFHCWSPKSLSASRQGATASLDSWSVPRPAVKPDARAPSQSKRGPPTTATVRGACRDQTPSPPTRTRTKSAGNSSVCTI